MSKYASLMTNVPQSEPLNPEQVQNNAGSYVFSLDDWKRLDRFLVLGSDSPTYYQNSRGLTRENAQCVVRCYAADPIRTVETIVAVSQDGRAPKNDPAIFALALGTVSQNPETRALALRAVPQVCRIATHLFQFVDTARELGRGWGRGLTRAVANWYTSRTVDQVAYQAVKYRSRENYTHKRMLQCAHPKRENTPEWQALCNWILGKEYKVSDLPDIVRAHLTAMEIEQSNPKTLPALIQENNLPWEALATEAKARPETWQAMLPFMGMTALIRNLGNMTRIGALPPLSSEEELVRTRLLDTEELRKSRIHPFSVLQALSVYRSGQGVRGSGTWTPSGPIVAALNVAFHRSFKNVEPTGKRHLIALDVSGSMCSPLMGSPLSVREAAAAMSLVTLAVEPATHVVGFADTLRPLPFTAGMSLQEAVSLTTNLPFARTDCAQPMLYALEKKIPVDVFVIYTDNETWAGRVHPSEALRRYRKEMGIDAKLIVVGMTSTGFTIADPADGGMMDVVGFDSAAPQVMSNFARG